MRRGIQAAQAGLLVNVVLVVVKLIAGLVGHAYVLVADAVESMADIFSSLIVWGGLAVAARPPDEDHPYGHGKAEPLAAAVVSLMLLGAAAGIAIVAVREIRTPHRLPAAYTLWVAVGVVAIKWAMARRVSAVADEVGSNAVRADAWHHGADAITSAAAVVGISVALWGGPGWESADDWAALLAAGVVAANGLHLLRPSIHALMDRAPEPTVLEQVRRAARGVEGVCEVENLRVRQSGLDYFVDIHVHADPQLTLRDAHELGARVKYAIMATVPTVASALVHMEPHEGDPAAGRQAAS